MFSFVFWVLLCWFIVNVIWMWFVLKNQTYQRVFAWIFYMNDSYQFPK